ncbi:MAG: tetratricopeptide repeat protein [Silvanigrellaceae bacterium]|nr:tetratricopeptide repeat protein [Silvanigrellaceae bacterium]
MEVKSDKKITQYSACGHDHDGHSHEHGENCTHDHHNHDEHCHHSHEHDHHEHDHKADMILWVERANTLRGDEDPHFICETYFNAAVYEKTENQDNKKYLDFVQKGLAFASAKPELLLEWQASFEMELGTYYLELNDLENAEQLLQKSFQYSLSHQDPVGLAFAQFYLAQVYENRKDNPKAKDLFQKALAITKEHLLQEPFASLRPQIEEKLSLLNSFSLKNKLKQFFK